MNLATILVGIPVAALIIWALIKTVKNRGRCSGCAGSCSGCAGCGSTGAERGSTGTGCGSTGAGCGSTGTGCGSTGYGSTGAGCGSGKEEKNIFKISSITGKM